MKVVVIVGGSVLVPTVEPDRVAAYASVFEELSDADHDLGIVVGGGPTAREYIGVARELGANEIELDQLGVAATRMNARLLIAALDDRAAPTPPEDHETARNAIRRGDIPVMGGTVAGHTTDAVGTALAEYIDADLLVYATSVSGVYDVDPDRDREATKLETLSPGDLVDIVREIEMNAGSNAPVDLLAAKLLQRSGLRAAVIDGTEPGVVLDAVAGDHGGTDITPN